MRLVAFIPWLVALAALPAQIVGSGGNDNSQFTAASFATLLATIANHDNISSAQQFSDTGNDDDDDEAKRLWCPLTAQRKLDTKVIGVAVCTAEFAPCSLCRDAHTLMYAVTAKGEISFLLDEAKQVSNGLKACMMVGGSTTVVTNKPCLVRCC